MKNKFYTILIALILCSLVSAFSACTKNRETTSPEDEKERTAVETMEEEDAPGTETISTENITIDGSIDSHEYFLWQLMVKM